MTQNVGTQVYMLLQNPKGRPRLQIIIYHFLGTKSTTHPRLTRIFALGKLQSLLTFLQFSLKITYLDELCLMEIHERHIRVITCFNNSNMSTYLVLNL